MPPVTTRNLPMVRCSARGWRRGHLRESTTPHRGHHRWHPGISHFKIILEMQAQRRL